jgi:signal transduction histidine kinase
MAARALSDATVLGEPEPAPAGDCLVVLDLLGMVVAVEGGAPDAWVGRSIDACSTMPDDVREAARALVRSSSRTGSRCVRQVEAPSQALPAARFRLQTIKAIVVRPSPFDLGALVRRLVLPMATQAAARGATLTLETDAAASLPVPGDANKIGWAITALVGGALRQVEPSGGHVVVRLRAHPQQQRATFSVIDDGQGIPAEVRAWLFEPRPETGTTTGFALRLVDEIVTAHGGHMVLSTPTDAKRRRGTEVSIWLPTGT